MVKATTGYVGIGTTGPGQKLDVSGNINVNTNGTAALISTFKPASTTGNNIFIGGGGQSSVYDGTNAYTGSYNTSVGINALQSNTTGYQNTANGFQALFSNTTGYSNTANGVSALQSNTTGNSNTANGMLALYSNTTGYQNTANGMQALFSNTTGYQNTANGILALYSNTAGYYNTANGVSALQSNTTGNNNTANGVQALFSNTAGYQNTANGILALYSNTTGNNNTVNGFQALYSNTTGYQNTANGMNAGRFIANGVTANQTSDNSVYEGYNAMAQASGDTNEIVIGASAIGNGSNTVTLGNTSIVKTILQGNVGIGTTNPGAKLSILGIDSLSTSFAANISGATGTGLVVNNLGNVGIGTTTPNWSLQVSHSLGSSIDINDTGAPTNKKHWLVSNNNGQFNIGTSTDALNATSSAFSIDTGGTAMGIGTTSPWRTLSVTGTVGFDGLSGNSGTLSALCLNNNNEVVTDAANCISSSIRYKQNIVTISTSATDEIMALRPVTFNYKPTGNSAMDNDPNRQAEQLGFVAEEAAQVDPRLVTVDANGQISGFRYENFTALLAKSIQEMNSNMLAISSSTASTTPASQSFAASFFSNLFSRIGQWLADATNGIGDVFANAFHAKQEICVDDQCLNADDVKNLLALVNGMASTTSAGTSLGSATSALGITILGNNPAHISVGDSYNDLGAMISAGSPSADLNLGITVNVDGGATTTPADIAIDTTAPGTHIITYSVTDSTGVTASAVRTVVVAPIAASADGSQTTATSTVAGGVASGADNQSATGGDSSGVATSTPDTTATTTAMQ
jgi:hypothetical protein